VATLNRLANETSLYLKQHAANPVDWYPWGPEALQRAAELERPIFLSVGYSACHWCHVMEHESFEDPSTAAVLNEHFVCIKVDREERPDLDQIYMTAHQLLTREGGGWPLSVFLAPNLAPFAAGTYFPPTDNYGRPSFKRVLAKIIEAWRTRRSDLDSVGQQVAEHLQNLGALEPSDGALLPELLQGALLGLKRSYDAVLGGFGRAPKFPHALEIRLLLRIGGPEALSMATHSLQAMARGGMYDQIGGGFHRYSVDAEWLVPHFEKMLYDNALLPPAYVEAFQITGDPFYEQIACETLDCVLKELTSPGGGFYSTLDADSEGEEGKFYVWKEGELDEVLGERLARIAKSTYGATSPGNFEGHSILFRSRSDAEDAKRLGLEVERFRTDLEEVKAKLYAVRAKRIWPGRDEKILAAWNGLMIAAFAQAGAAFGEAKYVRAAERAAEFVVARLSENGRLFRTCGADGPPKLAGYLEDYAYLTDAFVTLYEATFDPRWIREAIRFAETMLARFADEAGGFYFTADDHERLIARTKDLHDGSVPSGNAMAVTALLRLAALTGRADFRTHADRTLKAYHALMAEHPAAAGQMLIALNFWFGPVDEIAVVGSKESPEVEQILSVLRGQFRPNRVIAFLDPASGPPPAEIPLLADRSARGGVAVYVCRNSVCKTPFIGLESIMAELAR